MDKTYCRVTYNGIGIYEALKSKIWDNNSNFTKEDWEKFKKLENVNWLKVPKVCANNYYSYFTEEGITLFKKKTYPLIIKWLDKDKIQIKKYFFCIDEIKLIYSDEYQIILNNENK